MSGIVLGSPMAFERGDKLYITTPVTLVRPSDQEIEEYAFASAVKTSAPNEHIGWLSGKYVAGDRPNLNGAMWLSDELALKSLTPMLMPISVMHDPRTSVGVIADCKLCHEQGGSRIDNILAVWRHRYPEVWEEAEHNMQQGSLAQSMECLSPWYTCSDESCGRSYVKLPGGAEKASWCDHLLQGNSRRILRDTCFTGTGLIFGSRGGRPAYSDASLDSYREEIAEAHAKAHSDSVYRTQRSTTSMSLVQIEDTALAELKRERDEARASVDTLKDEKRDLTTKVETAEAAQKKAEDDKTAADKTVKDLQESAQRATLKDTRLATLGAGFMAKLGETSKAVINDLASKASDEEWDTALKEREEMAGVKRDAKAAAGTTTTATTTTDNGTAAPTFASEEVAAFIRGGAAQPGAQQNTLPPAGGSAVRALAKTFGKKPVPAGTNQGS